MPIVQVDMAKIMENRQHVRKSLRESVGIKEDAVPVIPFIRKSLRESIGIVEDTVPAIIEHEEIEEVVVPTRLRLVKVQEKERKEPATVLSHVTNISPKKAKSSYREDLLTSRK